MLPVPVYMIIAGEHTRIQNTINARQPSSHDMHHFNDLCVRVSMKFLRARFNEVFARVSALVAF